MPRYNFCFLYAQISHWIVNIHTQHFITVHFPLFRFRPSLKRHGPKIRLWVGTPITCFSSRENSGHLAPRGSPIFLPPVRGNSGFSCSVLCTKAFSLDGCRLACSSVLPRELTLSRESVSHYQFVLVCCLVYLLLFKVSVALILK